MQENGENTYSFVEIDIIHWKTRTYKVGARLLLQFQAEQSYDRTLCAFYTLLCNSSQLFEKSNLSNSTYLNRQMIMFVSLYTIHHVLSNIPPIGNIRTFEQQNIRLVLIFVRNDSFQHQSIVHS